MRKVLLTIVWFEATMFLFLLSEFLLFNYYWQVPVIPVVAQLPILAWK